MGVFALFLLQVVLGGVAPYADARLDAEASYAPVHLESGTSAACGLGHDHLFCSLCRALDLRAAPPMPFPAALDRAPTLACAPHRESGPAAAGVHALSHSPRAPPSA